MPGLLKLQSNLSYLDLQYLEPPLGYNLSNFFKKPISSCLGNAINISHLQEWRYYQDLLCIALTTKEKPA